MEALAAKEVVAIQFARGEKGILQFIQWLFQWLRVTWQTGQVPALAASSIEAAVPHSSPLTCTSTLDHTTAHLLTPSKAFASCLKVFSIAPFLADK